MMGLVYREIGSYPSFEDTIKIDCKADEVAVDVKTSGLNHRDVWITKGMYPGIVTPMILGSDGAGLVGERKVIINPNIDWGDDESFQSEAYQILGMPVNGTFADTVCVGKDRLHDLPSHLDFTQAAALPLNGLTAYRAVFTKGQVTSHSKVLVHGVGGGVALMALQFSLALGAEVYVTSSSAEKISKAVALGATAGFLYTNDGWDDEIRDATSGVDVVIDGAAGKGVNLLVSCCNPGARYVVYGGTKGWINGLSPQLLFWKQISLLGSTMGSDLEFKKMIDFVADHKIIPILDEVIPLSQGSRGFEKMDKGLQFGKIIFSHSE